MNIIEEIVKNKDVKMKPCSKCGELKNVEEFGRNKNKSVSQCKKCVKQRQRIWYLRKREEVIQRAKIWNLNHKEHRATYLKDYRFENIDDLKVYDKEYHHKYYLIPENKEHMKEQKVQYFKNNPGKRLEIGRKHFIKHRDKINKRTRKYCRKRYANDVIYKIRKLCSAMVTSALNGNPKYEHTMTYFMCTLQEFKDHIESQFEPWMNWNNRGRGPGTWQIDHIIPISFFTMADETEKYMCCRWQNLQPLSWEANMKKSGKVTINL